MYYRANVLFHQFDIQGPADRLLAYLTLFITKVFIYIYKIVYFNCTK